MTVPSDFLTIPQAAEVAGVSVQTFWRWALYGIRGGHKVATMLRGGRRFTTREAIEAFFNRLNAPVAEVGAPSDPPLPSGRSVRDAEASLDAEGI